MNSNFHFEQASQCQMYSELRLRLLEFQIWSCKVCKVFETDREGLKFTGDGGMGTITKSPSCITRIVSLATKVVLIALPWHNWSAGRQLFEIFTHPRPQCHSTRSKSHYNMINAALIYFIHVGFVWELVNTMWDNPTYFKFNFFIYYPTKGSHR